MPSRGALFVGAKLLTLVGILAVFIGLLLTVIGLPAAWVAGLGALLSLAAFGASYLLGRAWQRQLNRIAEESLTTIYMPLMNEGVDVWRPVEAMKVTDLGYMVTEKAPDDEEWVFQPGHILRCEEREVAGETQLVAVGKAT
jgi:hypothetical protein